MALKWKNESGEITNLPAAALEEGVAMDWQRRKHRHLSFASPIFNLESLEGVDERGEMMGLMHEEMHIRLLEGLDCSDNNLTEIECIQVENGFENLRSLKARRNQLTHFNGRLPQLLELNLAWNNLSNMPPTQHLKNLEILILAHNKIEGNWLAVKDNVRLKRFDIADNRFQMKPSELEEGLSCLSKLTGLIQLRLKDNPFTKFFSEYQIFCLQMLPSLTKLDDAPITGEVRMEAAASAHKLYSLSRYDEIYQTRKKTYDAKVAGKPVPLGFIPSIQDLNRQLEEVLRDPVGCLVLMDHFLQLCGTVYLATPQEHETLFHEIRADKGEDKDQLIKEQVDSMMQNIQLLLERHDSVALLAVRSVAKLCAVSIGGIGDRCITMLGQLMQGGSEIQQDVLDAIEETVIPLLARRKLTDPTVVVIMKGLAHLSKDARLLKPLGRAMTKLIKRLSGWLFDADLQHSSDLLSLLSVATKLHENVLIAQECKIPEHVVVMLDNRQLVQNESYRGMYMDLLIIAKNCASLGKEVVEAYANTGLHIKLIAQLKGFIQDDLGRMTPIELKTCSYLIDALTEMWKFSPDVLKESLLSYKVYGSIMRAPKAHTADPMLLASSLRAIHAILKDVEMRTEYIRDIVEDLDKMRPLLPYLGNKKYDQCFNLAERHRKDYNPRTYVERPAPALAALSNVLVHEAFVAIIELIEFFTAEEEEPLCKIVSENLNQQGRETALFTLLDVPSDDVKCAVMSCIEKVNLAELDSEEIGFLIKLMNDSKNIGAGKTEELLNKVIGQLERLVKDNESPAGQAFMSDHSEVAIHEVFDVLTRNEERQTYGSQSEEEEKTILSLGCVSFLRTCGRRLELRRFLRNPKARDHMTEILKNEDDLHTPLNPDIIIDRSITGSSVETLLRSFGGIDRLNANRRVAFRVTQRVADILEGRSDLLDGTEDLNSSTFAKREAMMLDDVKSKKHLKYLDDDEWDERKVQQASFTAASGFDLLLTYLDGAFVSASESDGQAAANRAVEDEALKFQYEMEGKAAQIVAEMDRKDQEARDKDEPSILTLDELDDGPKSSGGGGGGTSRQMLMGAMQTLHSAPPHHTVSLFLPSNPEFFINEDLFADERKGWVRPAFIVAAVLRCAHVMLVRPVAEVFRHEMIEYLKDADTVRKILMLMPHTGYLNCNVAAKFLRVMSRVLTLPPDVTSESIHTLLLFDMLSTFIKQLCVPALQVMKQTSERSLNVQEQVLCTEMARCVEIIGRNIPYIIFSAERQEPQELCVMKCLERFISITVVSTITQMILYDLQVDSGGSGGGAINADFAKGSMARKGMREMCSRVLAQHLQRCPPMKYAVLEAFAQAVVFGKQAIRASYMYELLAMLNQGQYAVGVETMLQEVNNRDRNNPERVLRLFECEICQTGSSEFRTLIVSNLSLYIMDKPKSTMHCGVCPPERFCPHAPTLSAPCSYLDICRLVKGYGSQHLIIGWIDPSGGERFQHVICHRTRDRDILVEMMHSLTAQGKGTELNDRAALASDSLSRAVIQEAIGNDPIFAYTYALRADQGDRLSLFVLTSANFYEFQVNFDNYGYDPDMPEADADDEIGPQMEDSAIELALDEMFGAVDNTLRESSKGNDDDDELTVGRKKKSQALASKLRGIRDRRNTAMEKGDNERLDTVGKGAFGDLGMSLAEKREALMKKVKGSYLTPVVEQPVGSITMIGFMPGDDPVLRLDVGGKVMIRFFDDLAREDWRRALACALNQVEGGTPYERAYASLGELG